MGKILSNSAFDSKKYSPLIYGDVPNFKRGTIDYDDFWDEQDYRCIHGYAPDGMSRIPGEHYFYLNMCKISLLKPGAKTKTPGAPFFRALDRRLSIETEEAKKFGHGLIVGKPRRVGLSWFGAMQIIYEMLFHYQNQVGVCAGKQDKANSFYSKVLWLLASINEHYTCSVHTKNDEKLKLGYSYRENKQEITEGLLSEMLIKTMYADSSAFEGESMRLVIFEEAGLFENLIKSYKATEPCFKEGAVQYGVPMIYGTGGEIEKGSKGYKEMWDDYKAYNLKKVFIPAFEYFPSDGIPNKKGEVISFFDMRTGETDEKRALAWIIEDRKRVQKNKEAYTKHIQSYPIKESEIFIKSSGGILDTAKLNGQLMRVNDEDIPVEPKRGILKWVDSDTCNKKLIRAKSLKEKALLRIKYNSKVKFKEDENGTVFKCADPINNDRMEYKPDIGGVDSYDDEIHFKENSSSYGAAMIYRCFSGPSREFDYPVAFVKERGDSSNDDVFYENTLKLAVYYNCEMLIEYSKTAIITYFKDILAFKYLRERPNLDAVIGPSKSRNEFGQRMNTKEKQLVTRLLKSDVSENCWKFYFVDHLIELIDYGSVNTDLAMAHGLCLIHKLDLFPDISEDLDEDEYDDDPLLSMTYYDVQDGKLVIKIYGEQNEDEDIQVFNPKLHASREEMELYETRMKEEITEREKIKADIESRYGRDIMAVVLNEFKT